MLAKLTAALLALTILVAGETAQRPELRTARRTEIAAVTQ